MATASDDDTVRLFLVSTGECLSVWRADDPKWCWAPVRAMRFSPDGQHLILACEDATVLLMDPVRDGMVRPVLPPGSGHSEPLRCMTMSPDGLLMATGGDDG